MDRKILYYLDKVESLIDGNAEMPVTVEIDPTNRCQLNCEYCMFKVLRNGPDKEDLPMGLYRYLLLDLKKIGVKSITFTGGGEPLLNSQFSKMVEWAEMLEFEYGLITNGLRLHKIDRPDKFKFIRVSLDAATGETYGKLKRANGFYAVIENIKTTINKGALVGLSYVVNEINRHEIEQAQELAKELGVAYIQFKPAWQNGVPYTDYEIHGELQTIDTKRFKAEDRIPCAIAGLIGIVGADARVYYCCQYRGEERYCLGDLRHATFPQIWERRPQLIPDIGRCPNCRYMNYTNAYKKLIEGGTLFFKHRNFL